MYYIGIDVGGTNLVAGLVDAQGSILHKESCPVDRSLDAQQLCSQIAHLAQRACGAKGIAPQEIAAVGVGVPGLADNHQGVVVQTPNMPFCNTPLRALFQAQWNVPVFLGNDANCAAIGEYWAGAAKDSASVVIVTLGTGIGGGMVVDGKLFTGFANGGMEIGHMITHPNGLPCGCGNRGCWEKYASATALIRMTRQRMQRTPDSLLWQLCQGDLSQVQGRTPFQGAEQGDRASMQVLAEYIQNLSLGIINLVNVLQPQVICLGGGVSNAAPELLLNPLRELVMEGAFDKKSPLTLVRASLGNDAGVVGAAMLCNSL